jgi:hypothetical protein
MLDESLLKWEQHTKIKKINKKLKKGCVSWALPNVCFDIKRRKDSLRSVFSLERERERTWR